MTETFKDNLIVYAQNHSLKTIEIGAGESIFLEGQPVTGLYFVLENSCKILKKDANGNDVFLWFAKTDEIIGLTSFFHENNTYTCSAYTGKKPCKFIFFSADEFTNLINHYPLFKAQILKTLCNRINFMELRFSHILLKTIDQRIIETLVFLASKEITDTNGQTKRLTINYSIAELSEMVGASLEYLKRKVRALKKQKLIDYGKNWFVIQDLNKLRLQH